MKILKQKKILFLEDNIAFANDTIRFLNNYVKEVVHVESIKDALLKFNEEDIDIIISDLKVQDGIALVFIEEIRQYNTIVPIVVLSAHKDEELLLKSIPLGLTTYAIKPINFEDFEKVLKKCSDSLSLVNSNKTLIKENTVYDNGRKLIILNDVTVVLTKKEAAFIELLLANKNSVVTKDMINEIIWENEIMSESALKNFLLRIRKKTYSNLFYTVQGIGYRL